MSTELEKQIDAFCDLLKKQTIRKAQLYDGYNNSEKFKPQYMINFLIEELGEIASAMTRDRFELAKCECIDLTHCAFLLWTILNKPGTKSN